MKKLLATIAILLPLTSFAGEIKDIIPAPQKVEVLKGTFRAGGASIKCDPSVPGGVVDAISRFSNSLSIGSGKTSYVSTPIGLKESVESGNGKGIIFLKDTSLEPEHYSINISSKAAIIKAGDLNGFIYAIETMKQLLPTEIYGNVFNEDVRWTLPCCIIEDGPRFGYRGMHLDCSRHFWTLDEIKKYLDVMAIYKLNRFHWHLTDDQGWRIEIKRYPLLSQIACYRSGTMIGHDFSSSDNIRYGGFYSQEEILEVVGYAAARGITVIPEIELPGHMLAAMSAYPWLGCTGGPYEAWTKWGVSEQVLCVGKESTFTFIENVLTEVAALFPGEYIHIGGDECPKTEWEKCELCQAKIRELGIKGDDRYSAEQYLQNYVTKRVQDFLATKGKKIIGWDEILEGELAPGATVMSWRGQSGGQDAAAKGFDAIMTPTSHFYFDYCQSEDAEHEPLCIGGFVSVEKVYSFDPMEGISPENQSHILGVQANLWTEYIKTEEHLEYMLLPRLLALSEVQWCTPENKDYGRFVQAVTGHGFKALDFAGYTYAKHLVGINGDNIK
ncbi:MAG: beta-N-acetylhexosaminidase [Bacteroidia bacterium]|nr:beta-N-acetylhexosaminidase [Bacteroidia bacterium]